MHFLHPLFLFAAAAILVPVIIHLFYFRRYKKVYFTNVSFLKELKEETSVRSRLRNLLVLILRCLAVLALVFAFAQPFISDKNDAVSKQPKFVSIYVDNSLSMTALSEEVNLLDRSKETARSIVNAYRKDDQFNVFTNQLDYRSRSLLDQEAALSMIEEIELGPDVLQLDEVCNFQNELFRSSKGERDQIAYLISDFQEGMASEEVGRDSVTDTYLIPVRAPLVNNVGIDSVWFERPVLIQNQNAKLFVGITNYGDEPAENTRLSFTENGADKPLGQLDIPANSKIVDTVSMSFDLEGYQHLSIQLSDYPVQFDDTFHIAFDVQRTFRVLHLQDEIDKQTISDFRSSSQLEVNSVAINQLDYSGINDYQLVIVDELTEMSSGLVSTLDAYLNSGGNVFYIPTSEAIRPSSKDFLSSYQILLGDWSIAERAVGRVNTDSYIFSDVFENVSANIYLPATTGSYNIKSTRAKESIMTYRDGADYLSAFEVGSGNFYILNAPLSTEFNNLTENPSIFVPMVYKMASSSNEDRSIAYRIGEDDLVRVRLAESNEGQDGVYVLRDEITEFIPSQLFKNGQLELNVFGQVKRAGTYMLNSPEGSKVAELAYNYNRRESDLAYLSEQELRSQFDTDINIIEYSSKANLTDVVQEKANGWRLWTIFVIMALLFLLGESLVLRFWKIN
jgi:hypothetical protein